jgi:hypothetical protein
MATESLRVPCPECGGQVLLKTTLAGKQVRCPLCAAAYVAPGPAGAPGKTTPRRPRQDAPAGTGLALVLILGGVCAAFLLVAVGVVVVVILANQGDGQPRTSSGGQAVGGQQGQPPKGKKVGANPTGPTFKLDPRMLGELDDEFQTFDDLQLRLPRGAKPDPENANLRQNKQQVFRVPYGTIRVSWGQRDDLGNGPGLVSAVELLKGQPGVPRIQETPTTRFYIEGFNDQFSLARARFFGTGPRSYPCAYYTAVSPPHWAVIALHGNPGDNVTDPQYRIVETSALSVRRKQR